MDLDATLSPHAARVRTADPAVFQTVLWAPAERRCDLLTLYALDVELARQAAMGGDPSLLQIRLFWWREALKGEGDTPTRGVPLLEDIDQMTQRFPGLASHLAGLADSHMDRHMDGASPDPAAIFGAAQKRGALLGSAAAWVLGGDALVQQAAGKAGAAWFLLKAALTRGAAEDAATGQAVLTVSDLVKGARAARRQVPRHQRSPFLLATLADRALSEKTPGHHDGGQHVDILGRNRPVRLFWAILSGRY